MRRWAALLVLTAARTAAAALPAPPLFDHDAHTAWREAARATIETYIGNSHAINEAASALRCMAAAIPQIAARQAVPFAPWAAQPRWRSIDDGKFIPAVVECIEEHLERAERLEPADHGGLGIDPSAESAVRFVAALRGNIIAWRGHQSARLRQVAEALLPASEEMYALFAAPHIRDWQHRQSMHVAFLAAARIGLGLADQHLAADLLIGLPIWGTLDAPGVWPQEANPEPPPRCPSAAECAAWNRRLYEDLTEKVRGTEEDNAECWKATMAEVEGVRNEDGNGWKSPPTMQGPFTWDEIEARHPRGWCCMRRFPVTQHGQCRPCDDGHESGHNAATRSMQKLTCIGPDWTVRVAAAFIEAMGADTGWDLLTATDDLFKAYRMVGTCAPSLSIVALRDLEGRVRFFELPSFVFGLKSAVYGFNRVPATCVEIARRLLACCSGSYFDDFPTVEPSFALDSGQCALHLVQDLTGFPLAPAKSKPPSLVRKFLGIMTDFTRLQSHGEARLYVEKERAARITAVMTEARRAGHMSRRDAERLNGKLTFALSYVAYRVGRGVMQPLIRWASGHPRAQQSTSWQAVDKALAFLITLLSLLPPRIFRLRGAPPRPCVKVWTDAAWEPTSTAPATVGIVVYIPPEAGQRGRYLYSSMVVPEEYMQQFQVRRQYIGQLELLAAVAAYTTFHAELRDRRVIHWIDNTSALAGLIRGYAGAIDSAHIVHAFHALNAGLRTDVWFEYIASKANIADLPSRMDFDLLRRLRAQERPCVLPATDEWLLPAQTWLEARRFCEASEKVNTKRHRAPDGGGAVRGRRRGMRHRAVAAAVVDVARAVAPMAAALGMANTEVFKALYVRNRHHEAYDVYVGRATRGSPFDRPECDPAWVHLGRWGNEFTACDRTPDESARIVRAHRDALLSDPRRVAYVRRHLAGRTLASGLDEEACHAGTLAEVANCSTDHLARLVREAADAGAGV